VVPTSSTRKRAYVFPASLAFAAAKYARLNWNSYNLWLSVISSLFIAIELIFAISALRFSIH
jgi:hypothetical protein